MSAFDSIINVEEWISDHYFSSEEKGKTFANAVKALHKGWKDEQAHSVTPWLRLKDSLKVLERQLATYDPSDESDVKVLYGIVSQAFGLALPVEVVRAVGAREFSCSAGVAGRGEALVLWASAVSGPDELIDAVPLAPVVVDGKAMNEAGVDFSAHKLVGELFLSDEDLDFITVLAGSWVMLAERSTWPLGRFLAVDLATAVSRNNTKSGGELQQVTAIVAQENVLKTTEGTTWWYQVIDDSRNHAVQVSAELRNAVKRSIEIIGNDVVSRFKQQNITDTHIDGVELTGQNVAKQSLRYLYRILFLLFAEASPELEILPTGAPEYDEGYGLARLRDQILSPPETERAQKGTHLYESLQLLFTLVNEGHDPTANVEVTNAEESLHFRNLSADLFRPQATCLIDACKLSNLALHQVLSNLFLSREERGKDRGFISYATLGVTELGQVYEGLMSYTGFIAEEELVEVAPHGNPEKGSWVVPLRLLETLPVESIVYDLVPDALGGMKKQQRTFKPGSFVFRQSSRDRERSASFYTPQVLTEFTVGQAIEELQANGRISCADDILTLSICEPAMGSGAFAVEAVRQLAALYLEKKQHERGQRIPAESFTQELQKVKASIALHQVYGVDLNATAVELAEISLWLDTMTSDLQAPWFGLHLRHGNSLIGAKRATYTDKQVTSGSYLKEAPTLYGLNTLNEGELSLATHIHQFLLPSTGWGSTADSKDVKDLAAEEIKLLKSWRAGIKRKLTKTQVKHLQGLAQQVEALWKLVLIRMQIAEEQSRRAIVVFGQEASQATPAVTREQIENELFKNPNGSYQRLRLVMDMWFALWFWPLDKVTADGEGKVNLPTIDEWIDALTALLGTPLKKGNAADYDFTKSFTWDAIEGTESYFYTVNGAKSIEHAIEMFPWLKVVQDIAKEQAFFHWDLDFASVMATGGFDLQVGNPPWVRPRTDVDAALSEIDPWFKLASKPTQAEKKARKAQVMAHNHSRSLLLREQGEVATVSTALAHPTLYPALESQQPDLYRAFMPRTWSNMSDRGVVSLIHPESHFTEKKAVALRAPAYLHLRRHWQFINALMLFDIDDHVVYGVHVYGSRQEEPDFLMAAKMYHPETAAQSLHHDGTGELPGIKDPNYNWDCRPHRDRIMEITTDTLRTWNSILEEPGTPLLATRMVYTVNSEAAEVLAKLATQPRMRELNLNFSSGWHESGDKKAGYFDIEWKIPASWNDVILQGPHLGVSTPMIKQPNPTMKHNQDWSEIDFEAMPADFIPATAYQPNRGEKPHYDDDYGHWGETPVIHTYRMAWRRMAATTGFRTLYPSLIPPHSAHIDGMFTMGPITAESLTAPTFASSLLCDFVIRATGVANIFQGVINTLPCVFTHNKIPTAVHLYLRLNCMTSAYAELWESVTGTPWTSATPLRVALGRRQAQDEIDAIVALSLGISIDELIMIYKTQFPVMYRYDQEQLFDANGRLVPKELLKREEKKKAPLAGDELTWTHPQSHTTYTYEYPFTPHDREQSLRNAYTTHAL